MLGVLSSFWLFSLFIDPQAPHSMHWLQVCPWLSGASALTAVIVAVSPLDERSARPEGENLRGVLTAMPQLLSKPFVVAFLACAFLDVLVE